MPLVMTGCNNPYKAVVQDVSENVIYVTDVETGDNKSISIRQAELYDLERFSYLCHGDTITILSPYGRDVYNKKPVIVTSGSNVKCNMDSIEVRKERHVEEFILRNRQKSI